MQTLCCINKCFLASLVRQHWTDTVAKDDAKREQNSCVTKYTVLAYHIESEVQCQRQKKIKKIMHFHRWTKKWKSRVQREKQYATLQAVDENRNTNVGFLLSVGDSFTHFLSHFLFRVAKAQNAEMVKLNADLRKNNNNNFTFKQAAVDVTS